MFFSKGNLAKLSKLYRVQHFAYGFIGVLDRVRVIVIYIDVVFEFIELNSDEILSKRR
jgi:hypothetical protein